MQMAVHCELCMWLFPIATSSSCYFGPSEVHALPLGVAAVGVLSHTIIRFGVKKLMYAFEGAN